jgi:hypothetical protein
LKDKEICINCANLVLQSCNRNRLIKCRYCNSGKHKNFKDLQKREYNSQYIRFKHVLQLIHKYSVTFKWSESEDYSNSSQILTVIKEAQ